MIAVYRMLLEIMSDYERRRFYLVLICVFVLSVFEAASVLSILPFLQLVADPGIVETNPALSRLYAWSGASSIESFTFNVGALVFAITVLGLIVKALTVWITTRFALMRSYSMSRRLLSAYLHQPYIWYLSRHSADLGNVILAEVDKMVSGALLPAMRLIPEILTILLLVAALFLLEPMIAIGSVVVIGGAYLLFYASVRRLLLRIGEIRLATNKLRFHTVQEAMGGVKEMKLMTLEEPFLKRFSAAAFKMANVQTLSQILAQLPRFALEGLLFGGIILVILFLIARNSGDLSQVVPTLGLIAAAGLRLFPALQQVYARFSSVRSNMAVLEHIHADIVQLSPATQDAKRLRDPLNPRVDLNQSLELRNVTFTYPGADRTALHGVDMLIEARSTIGIVGGTGAGKTTLVDIMLGLLDPQGGELVIDGTPLDPATIPSWQRSLGYVPQHIFLSDATVLQNIAFGVPKDEIDREMAEAAARIASLHDFVLTELPQGYETEVGERGVRLSGGQRQRIGIARALYRNPSTIIFDEATSALDNLTERAVMEAVHNMAGQKTIIMIAHRLSTVRNCDQIVLMQSGQVAAQGTFDELLEANSYFRALAQGT